MKKAVSLIVCLVLIMIVFTVTAEAADGGGGVAMTVDVGYSGMYVVGKTNPVLVTVKNSGKEIKGTIELQTGTDFTTLVRKEVVLPENTEKQFVLFTMTDAIYTAKNFEVKLKSGGATVASATPKAVSGIDPDKQLCGILSDDAAAVSYMKKVTFSQYGTKSWVELTRDSLYADANLLSSFSVLAISNFDSASLSQDQRDAIAQWVYTGGTLVIGTGPGREATLGQWQDFLSGLAAGGTATAADLGGLSSLGQGKDYKTSLPVLNIKNTGWTVDAHAENNMPLILQKGFGKGVVFMASYDLGDGGMGAWAGNNIMWQTLFDRAASGYVNQNNYQYYGGYYGMNSGMNMALRSGFAGGNLFFLLFVVVLVVFTAAVGFISYAVLRKLNRQKLMWLTIPALAVLCSGFLLLCGRTSFGRAPYMFAFTSTDVSGGVSLSEREIAFSAPAMGRYKMSVDGAKMIFPLEVQTPDYYGPMPTTQPDPAKKEISIIASADSAELEFLNVNLNGSREAQFNTFSRQSPLEVSLVYDGKMVNCKLKNNSSYAMNDVAVLIGGSYKVLGRIEAGAEAKTTMALDQAPIDQNIWNYVQSQYSNGYTGIFNGFNKTDQMKSIKGQLIQEKFSMVTAVSSTPAVTTSDLGQSICIGWIERPFEYAVNMNGRKVTPQSLELITATVPITQSGDAGLQIIKAFAQLDPTSQMNAGTMNGSMLDLPPGTSAVLDFNLTGYTALNLSDMTFDAGLQQGMPSGKWSIYNWKTNGWDIITDKQHYAQGEMEKYIDANGLVRLTVSVGSNDYLDCTPFVWVQGVKK